MGFTLNQLEQERQIRKLQKKEDKDTKDYEQLSNLPKINNVELKGDKTTSDLGINADNVMMSDGVTSVEDRLDAYTFGSNVDIKPYNTTSNQYTCPSDGYLYLYVVNSGSKLKATINTSIPITAAYNGSADAILIFLKKGMKIRCDNAGQSTDIIGFYPLT